MNSNTKKLKPDFALLLLVRNSGYWLQ